MSKKLISLVLTAILAFGIFSAAEAAAQVSDVCTRVTASGTEGPLPPDTSADVKVAVASNFVDPAIDIAKEFVLIPAHASQSVLICENASGDLVNEIINRGNPYGYSIFFAANQEFAEQVAEAFSLTAFPYVAGIPVLYSVKLTVAEMYNSTTNKIDLDNVESLAEANPDTAPYGAAAVQIETSFLNQLAQLEPITTIYSNITLAFQAVQGEQMDAGFVAKSQICKFIPGAAFVEFPTTYDIPQYGSLIKLGGTTILPLAEDFKDFVLSPTIQTRLVNMWCYRAASTVKAK
jgi:molybdate transport system substrate-binding protein